MSKLKELKETIQGVFSLNYDLIQENAKPDMLSIYFARRDLAQQLLKEIEKYEHQAIRENVGWGQYETNYFQFFIEGEFNCINCNNKNEFILTHEQHKDPHNQHEGRIYTCKFCGTENTVYYEFNVKVKKKEEDSNE